MNILTHFNDSVCRSTRHLGETLTAEFNVRVDIVESEAGEKPHLVATATEHVCFWDAEGNIVPSRVACRPDEPIPLMRGELEEEAKPHYEAYLSQLPEIIEADFTQAAPPDDFDQRQRQRAA